MSRPFSCLAPRRGEVSRSDGEGPPCLPAGGRTSPFGGFLALYEFAVPFSFTDLFPPGGDKPPPLLLCHTVSFRARHCCLCSEYISSIPAPCASPDTKISLFAVLRSFARGIFRPDDIEKSGNTCCIPGFFCDGWAEKGRAKPVVSLICTPFSTRLFAILPPPVRFFLFEFEREGSIAET